MATTPAARWAASRVSNLLRAPRSLNEPVACNVSSFRKTSHPVISDSTAARTVGVRRTAPASAVSAARISAIVTGSIVILRSKCGNQGQSRGGGGTAWNQPAKITPRFGEVGKVSRHRIAGLARGRDHARAARVDEVGDDPQSGTKILLKGVRIVADCARAAV